MEKPKRSKREFITEAEFETAKIKFYMHRRGIPEDILEDILHWSNAISHHENKREKYYIADRLIDIYLDDRFIIFQCETCGETTITAELTEDEKDFFDNPNGPEFDSFMESDTKLCQDCEAALSL